MSDAAVKSPPAREKVRSAPPERAPVREAVPTDRAVAIGLDGQPVWRKGTRGAMVDDQFEVPSQLKKPGFEYEWKRWEVLNMPDRAYHAKLYAQGWQHVHHEMGFDGIFMPSGAKGPILVDHMALMARPFELCEEARREDRMRAVAQVNDAKKKHGMGDFLPNESSFRVERQHAQKHNYVKTERVDGSEMGRPDLPREIPDA